MKYYIGIDLGGTNIKAGILDEEFHLLTKDSCKTNAPRPGEALCTDMAALVGGLLEEMPQCKGMIQGVGIGSPGTINSVTGVVEYSNNLQLSQFPMRDCMTKELGKWGLDCPVCLANDANAAALGELCAGSAKGCANAVVITLGTGVGSGIIIDSKIYSGFNCAGGEIGHTVIVYEGKQCTCGRRGCLEAYASATGLVNLTKEAMTEHPESLLHSIAQEAGKVDGRTAFHAKSKGDAAGTAVIEAYVGYLACGLANVINALQPEIICIGGGISKEGENLLAPLREKIYDQVFCGKSTARTKIAVCTAGNDAGLIGSGALVGELSA